MTAQEKQKLVDAIQERVVLMLGPLGILVAHEMMKDNYTIAEFTFKIPEVDKSKPGTYQELIVHFTQTDAHQCKTDPKQLDCLPRAWARICAEWAPSLFDEAKLPNADGVDWRPQETLPEDFYAA
jgi:hypothetical protein